MTTYNLLTICFFCLFYYATCNPVSGASKEEHSVIGELDSVPITSHNEQVELEKRGWNNLSGGWGKRGWNNLSGAWGKRNKNWNNLNNMWGKRDWNNLSNMWGKKSNWNNLSGAWGKRGWNNLSGAWGKREDWDNADMLDKRGWDASTMADENNKRTKWNQLNGMWGKRSGDKNWAIEQLYRQGGGFEDESDEPMAQDHL